MGKEHSENRNGRLQNRGQSGRNVQLAPKKQGVVQAKHQNSCERERQVIATIKRPQAHPAERYQDKRSCSNDEANGDKRYWRQITQSDFDREPGGAPNNAEGEPSRWNFPTGRFHSRRHSRESLTP